MDGVRKAVLAGGLVGLLATQLCWAQATREPGAGPKWEKPENGLEILRLWQTSGLPKEPQIAILRLSDDEYSELQKSFTHFLENENVFGTGLKLHGVSWVDLSETRTKEEKEKSKTGADPWIVVVVHTKYCTTATVSEHIP
jgi:hypothetical protein